MYFTEVMTMPLVLTFLALLVLLIPTVLLANVVKNMVRIGIISSNPVTKKNPSLEGYIFKWLPVFVVVLLLFQFVTFENNVFILKFQVNKANFILILMNALLVFEIMALAFYLKLIRQIRW